MALLLSVGGPSGCRGRLGLPALAPGAVACRIVGVSLLIAPEVVAALGGPAQARATLGRTRGSSFRCTQCGQQGRYTDEPAAVVVRMVDRGGQAVPVVSFAHPGCSGSRVEPATSGLASGMPSVRAAGWVDTDCPVLRAVLLLATRTTETARTAQGDTIELLMAALHGDGFATLPDLAAPLPALSGLRVYGTADRLLVQVDGYDLYDGPPPDVPDWSSAAASEGRVRVLVAAGIDVTNPDQDVLLAELFTAMGRGLVVGAAGGYRSGSPQPRSPWRSGRGRRRGGRRR